MRQFQQVLLQGANFPGKQPNLEAVAGVAKRDPKGGLGCLEDCLSASTSQFPTAMPTQQSGSFIQIGFEQIGGGWTGFQQSQRRFPTHGREECLEFRKHLVEQGFEPQIRFILQSNIGDAVSAILARLHATSTDKQQPPDHRERNQRIRELYASGMTQAEIGALFGITGRRVSDVLNGKRTRK
jgi:hypothetical protein